VFVKVLNNHSSLDIEKRPNNVTPAIRNAAEAVDSGSAQYVEKNRFDSVISIVAGRDIVEVACSSNTF
jgi:hypothetical protein